MPEAAFLRVVSGWLQPERVHFSLLYNNNFFKYLSFLKQPTCHFLTESLPIVQFRLIRVTTGMAVNTHGTLSPNFFSYGIEQCVLRASLHSSETARKPVLRWGRRAESLAGRRLGTEYPRGVNCTERDPWRSAGGPPGFQQHTDKHLCRRKLSKAGERTTQKDYSK